MPPFAITIRDYHSHDRSALVALLARNTPRYFAPAEQADFEDYLDHKREHYYVVVAEEQIVGCGGINYWEGGAVARLSWDIIHPDYQGIGLGRALLLHRLATIRARPDVRAVVVRTTQLVYGFYEKMGFVLVKTQPDFWAPGLDLYQLELRVG